jgi:hypothetical protein
MNAEITDDQSGVDCSFISPNTLRRPRVPRIGIVIQLRQLTAASAIPGLQKIELDRGDEFVLYRCRSMFWNTDQVCRMEDQLL